MLCWWLDIVFSNRRDSFKLLLLGRHLLHGLRRLRVLLLPLQAQPESVRVTHWQIPLESHTAHVY